MNLLRLKNQWSFQKVTYGLLFVLGYGFILPQLSMAQSQDASASKADSKNYKIIVGFGAGGIPDSSSRMIAPKLAEKMKSTAIVGK